MKMKRVALKLSTGSCIIPLVALCMVSGHIVMMSDFVVNDIFVSYVWRVCRDLGAVILQCYLIGANQTDG